MLFELLGGFFVAIVILWGIGEYTRKLVFCLIASAMLFPLGAWTLGDGIQVKIGENETSTSIVGGASTASGNNTIYDEIHTMNSTLVYNYEDIPSTPYLEYNNVVAMLCFLLGLFGIFHYGLTFLERK